MFKFLEPQLIAQLLPLEYPTADCSGKSVIVTGANVGLGLEAARHFVRLNAERVILGCRDLGKAEEAKNEIELSERRVGVVEVWHLDLGSFDSVIEFCERAKKLDRLDVVIENAGLATRTYESYEGHERQITVNVISTFLMALLLLPSLRRTTTQFNTLPHLVIVSSDAHYYASFEERTAPSIFEALKSGDNMMDRYNTSKLLEILIVRELAREMEKTGAPKVVLNTACPGFCRTSLYRDVPFPLWLAVPIALLLLGRTSEMGSRTLVKAAVADEETHGKHIVDCSVGNTFRELYEYSIANRSEFYAEVFDYVNLIHAGSYTQVVDESKPIDSIPRWFEGIELNWAENLLWSRGADDPKDHRGKAGKEDSRIALTEVREGVSEIRHVTYAMLRKLSGIYAAALHAGGVRRGDRIVVVGANSVETLVIFTATTWLGGIFSSSSTDMGTQGILQRTVQINPKYIFMDDAALYNGKRIDLRRKMAEVVAGMESCDQFAGLVSIRRFRDALDISEIPKTQTLEAFLRKRGSSPPPITRIAFHEPFLIYFSSGTTGIPKAIVHSIGGVLMSYAKEARLHEDATPDVVSLQYTTTGWIMYLVCVGQLLCGARVILYDGSPFQPDLQTFVKLIGDQKVTKLGTSPRWFHEMSKAKISPREITDLSNLRLVTSTGMVLSDRLFEWFYDEGFPSHVHLSNISGGTDIAGTFAGGNPLDPVYVGGTQGPCLGTPIALYDSLLPPGPGKEVPDGTPGELVATASFPNVPVYLWGDKMPPAVAGSKYHSAYFARYEHVWAHGDFCVVHPVTKNITFLGRADGVLNPSGVRFGSAEVYSVIERNFADRVADSVCVGQRRPQDADESVMLFLLMRPGHKFNRRLVKEVKEAIGTELTKRHVPKYVFETPEIPTTVNLKKVELPIKQIVSGQVVKPSGTLLNPGSLDYYYRFAKVEDLVEPKEKL
ncbi:hypothetical protein DL767_011179 [Monosporascus sp. MG133]|nr:hypothetical protein DL767_011179 [Monosporascus sp. MG133]